MLRTPCSPDECYRGYEQNSEHGGEHEPDVGHHLIDIRVSEYRHITCKGWVLFVFLGHKPLGDFLCGVWLFERMLQFIETIINIFPSYYLDVPNSGCKGSNTCSVPTFVGLINTVHTKLPIRPGDKEVKKG